MAHFTVQGGLKQLFNGDRVLFGFETKDPFHCKSGCGLRSFMGTHPIHFHKNKMSRFYGSSRIVSSLGRGKKSNSSNAEERLGDTDDGADDEIDEVGEFENDELSCFRGLVLDISYRPVNVVCWKRAICLEFMEKADVLEYYDQTVNSPSGSYYIPAVLRVPQLVQVVKRRRIKQCLSRKNIFYRDAFTWCQPSWDAGSHCDAFAHSIIRKMRDLTGDRAPKPSKIKPYTSFRPYLCEIGNMYCSSRENLTIDHVVPIARGGGWNWENLVTACVKCNSKKGPKTLEEANMKLNKVPKAPKEFDILAIPLTTAAMNMLRKKKTMPEEWRQYLSMDSKSSTSEP